MGNINVRSLSRLFNGAPNIYFPSLLSDVGILQRRIEVRFASTVDQQIVDSASVGHIHTHLQRVQLGSVNQETQNLYDTRLLKIAIIGVPNVGKSTIINQLVGRRVCSISSKVHTTRCKARAIAVHGNTQLVFLDTPGLVTSDESQRHRLERAFHLDSEEAMLEADAMGVVHDVSNTWTRERLDPMVLRLLHLYPEKHSFLIINKNYLLHISKPSPWLYPASQYTDQPSETVIVNTVKSKLLDHLPQEIPYNLTTVMEYYDVGTEGTISAVVLVGCPTLRIEKLLVGSHGLRIRAIAREAEQELQNTFRQPVRLKVVVTNKSQIVSGVPPES